MDDNTKKVNLFIHKISAIKDIVNKDCNNRVLEMKLESVRTLHNEANSLIERIYVKGSEKEQAIILPLGDKLESVTLEVEMKITGFMTSEASINKVDSSNTSLPRLPKLELPTFEGGYTEWVSFFDLFNCAIDKRTDLSNVQKLQYLKCSVKGEPSKLIRTLPLIGSNYTVALELLKKRYSNKKTIRDCHLAAIFNLKPISSKSSVSIRFLVNSMVEHIQSLKNIEEPVQHWSSLLIFMLKERLDPETRIEWEQHSGSNENPTLDEMIEFLLSFARILEAAAENNKGARVNTSKSTYLVNKESCPLCSSIHNLLECSLFNELNPRQKYSEIKRLGLCFNCFGRHYIKDCEIPAKCSYCSGHHNNLLHFGNTQSNSTNLETQSYSVSPGSRFQNEVLLQTAVVLVKGKNGVFLPCRMLLDNGSQVSIITKRFKRKLQVPGKVVNINVSGVGMVPAGDVNETVTVEISVENNTNIHIEALVMDSLSHDLPKKNVVVNWPELAGVKLADPGFNCCNTIDMLIGADNYYKLIPASHNIKISPDHNLFAIETLLGWVITGPVAVKEPDKVVYFCSVSPNENDLFQKFWGIEEIPTINSLSEEEVGAQQHYDNTTYRDKTGKYFVKLPLIRDYTLGDSRTAALKRFYNLERKFRKNYLLKCAYVEAMDSYFENQFAEKVPILDLAKSDKFYIPHHAIIKEDSSTTKVRVVFDASAKSRNGNSLNDLLLIGPNLQSSLFDILLRFRLPRIVYAADIEKMYSQIGLQNDDRDLHRFFWRDAEHLPLNEYRMATVTFGVASSSYHAQATLSRLVYDEGDSYGDAAQVILKNTYMDDVLSGEDTIDGTIDMIRQLIALLKLGNFNLRKWVSNEPEVLKSIPENLQDTTVDYFDFDKSVKTLGLRWIPSNDVFVFHVPDNVYKDCNRITKRNLLSDLSKIFDPLGLISPVVMVAKILFQGLWSEKMSWDDEVSSEVHRKWLKWRKDLVILANVKIVRCIKPSWHNKGHVELHGFGDASVEGYAAVIYLRYVSSCNQIKVSLLTSKTKVAPIQKLSVPRLELCAALLTAKLVTKVVKTLNLEDIPITAWSDSTVTLYWIKSNPLKWKTFVSNRTRLIRELVPCLNWRYCPTDAMPADGASRGMPANKLINDDIWWKGPKWLSCSEDHWPVNVCTNDDNVPNSEGKPSFMLESRLEVSLNTVFSDISTMQPIVKIDDFSSLSRLLRVTAWIRRWFYVFKNKDIPRISTLRSSEMVWAELYWVKLMQQEFFGEEISCLAKGEVLNSKSSLITLNPFLDENQLLRVGGRLKRSSLSFDRKHPILIHPKHKLATLIIGSIHLKGLHAPISLTLSMLRKTYWLLKGRKIVRGVILKCTTCRRYSGSPLTQLMGDLPRPRIEESRVFANIGLDYAGPIMIKVKFKRSSMEIKSWIALFVCLSSKAVHLELVTSYSADAFIDALKRFVARRGRMNAIYCDNAGNFTGASAELKELREMVLSLEHNENVSAYLAEQNINWHFSPPTGSHFGGIWEAAVKRVKFHLYRIVGNGKLTYEESNTLLCQIEAMLNSRPLTPLSSDPNDLQALTPGHFLIGCSLTEMPEPWLLDIKLNRLNRYQHITRLKQHFWKRWKDEYLQLLQTRQKWKKPEANLQLNDLVLLFKDDTPASKWPLGRVIELHPGKDDLVRVVTVKTANASLKRPITKLIKLFDE